jgi:hypothetical protein
VRCGHGMAETFLFLGNHGDWKQFASVSQVSLFAIHLLKHSGQFNIRAGVCARSIRVLQLLNTEDMMYRHHWLHSYQYQSTAVLFR